MDYQIYCEKREDWTPALKVYNDWKAKEARRARMTMDELIGDLTKGAISITMALMMLGISNDPRGYNLWITSPSGKSTVQLPFYTALRAVRKRKWWITETVPAESKIPQIGSTVETVV